MRKVYSDYTGGKLEINSNSTWKIPQIQKLNQISLYIH